MFLRQARLRGTTGVRLLSSRVIVLMGFGFIVDRIVGDLKPLDDEQSELTLKPARSSA